MATTLYRTKQGIVVERDGAFGMLNADWDALFIGDALSRALNAYESSHDEAAQAAVENELLPPIGSQEVWASGG